MKTLMLTALAGLMLAMGNVAQAESEHMFGLGVSYASWDSEATASADVLGVSIAVSANTGESDDPGVWLAYRWQHEGGGGTVVRAEHFGGDNDSTTLDLLGTYTFRNGLYLGGGFALADIDGLDGNNGGVKVVLGGLVETEAVGHVDIALEYFQFNDIDYSNERVCANGVCADVDVDFDFDGFVFRVGYLF